MNSMKDSKKLEGIFLAIDILLVFALVVVGLFCFRAYRILHAMPELNYETTSQTLSDRCAGIQQQIDTLKPQIAERDAQSDALYAEAQAKLADNQAALAEATALRDATQAELNQLNTAIAECDAMPEKITQIRTEYGEAVRQLEDLILAGETDLKICYLTFDDGPNYLTHDFLEKLEELDIYATFFTVGVGLPEYDFDLRDDALRRQAAAGHTIANHTYTHAFDGALYQSPQNFMDAVLAQNELVLSVTGIPTEFVRFPCGSYYSPYRERSLNDLNDAGFGWVDWTCSGFDSGDNGYSAERTAGIVINAVRQESISCVLLHDWNPNTLGSLDAIVSTLRQENYVFLPMFKQSVLIGYGWPAE